MEGTAKAVWNGAGGGRTRSPEPRIGSGRRVPLAAMAVLMTVVMALAAVSIWTPGCEDADAETEVLCGILYERDGDVLTISAATQPEPGFQPGDWPDAMTFALHEGNQTTTTLRVLGGLPSLQKYYFQMFDSLQILDLSLSDVTEIQDYCLQYSNDLMKVIFPNDASEFFIGMNSFVWDLVDEKGSTIHATTDSKPGYELDDIVGYTFELSSGQLVRQEKSYTVSFDPDGGQWPDGTSQILERSCKSGTGLDLSEIAPTKESCTLAGWLDDSGNQYKPGDEPEIYGDLKLKAVWEQKATGFTVTFDPNGGAWSGSSEPLEYTCVSGGTVEPATVDPPTKESCTFDGWSFNGKKYSAGEKVEVLSDMTFTAEWISSGEPVPVVPVDPVTPTVPIAPFITVDGQETIEVLVDEDKDSGDGKDVKTILLIAIVAAIIAELAVLSISRRG